MRKNYDISGCPAALTVGLIGNKWKLFVLRDLSSGTKRFGQLRSSIPGISQKMLTQTLREMEQDRLLTRKVYPEVPPRVEYSLSRVGHTLSPLIAAMADWGEKYKKRKASATYTRRTPRKA